MASLTTSSHLLMNSSHAYACNFIISHFLDVDHVGHRIGTDRPIIMYSTYGTLSRSRYSVIRQQCDDFLG